MRGIWREITVGVLILTAAGLLAFMSVRVGTLRVPGARTFTLYFNDAAGLVENAPVTAAGIKVGSVDKMEYDDHRAKITIRVSPAVDLRTDAHAAIRARSLLGEKYVALEPGTADEKLAPGDQINTLPTYDIDRLLAAVATLAESVDPEDMKGLIHGLSDILNARTADGQSLADATAQLATSMASISQKADQLVTTGNQAAKKVGPALDGVQQASAKLVATLDGLDGSFDDLPETMQRLDRVLTRMDEILEKNQNLSQESILEELRKITHEEGIYVRLTKPNKK